MAISQDASAITTDKGFRSARTTLPIREGAWYWEIVVERGGGKQAAWSGVNGNTNGPSEAADPSVQRPHVRLGVARREAPVNAPVGLDGYSYGIRDVNGAKVTFSRPQSYGEGFASGDVIGVYIYIPQRGSLRPPSPSDPPKDPDDPSRIVRKRIAIKYKGQMYFESLEYAPSKEMTDLAEQAVNPSVSFKNGRLVPQTPDSPTAKAGTTKVTKTKNTAPPPGSKVKPSLPAAPPPRPIPVLEGSKLAFFKNGRCMGVAFDDLLDWLPLRQRRTPGTGRSKGGGGAGGDELLSEAARIERARENDHDDGTLGYYPFVSVYGGGIASFNAGPDFHSPPDLNTLPDGLVTPSPLRELFDIHATYTTELDKIDEAAALSAYQRDRKLAEAAAEANAEKARRAAAAAKKRAEKIAKEKEEKAQERRDMELNQQVAVPGVVVASLEDQRAVGSVEGTGPTPPVQGGLDQAISTSGEAPVQPRETPSATEENVDREERTSPKPPIDPTGRVDEDIDMAAEEFVDEDAEGEPDEVDLPATEAITYDPSYAPPQVRDAALPSAMSMDLDEDDEDEVVLVPVIYD